MGPWENQWSRSNPSGPDLVGQTKTHHRSPWRQLCLLFFFHYYYNEIIKEKNRYFNLANFPACGTHHLSQHLEADKVWAPTQPNYPGPSLLNTLKYEKEISFNHRLQSKIKINHGKKILKKGDWDFITLW